MAVTTNRRSGSAAAPANPPRTASPGRGVGPGWGPGVVRTAPVPSRRRPAQLLAGLVLAAVGALAAWWIVNDTAQRVPVLVIARPVAVGQVIADADVAISHVAVDRTVAVVPAARRADVVGQVARTELVAGAVLAPDQIGPVGPPTPGQVLVVIAVPASRMPATGLAPGTSILVVSTPTVDADAAAAKPPASIAATVIRVGTPDLNGLTPVDVAVPAGDGPALAARAATGRIAVVVRPSGR